MPRVRPIAAVLALAAGLAASAAEAAIWGVVVGVDDYVYQRPLKGAAADARDIATALQTRGAASVKVLLNQAATKAAVTAAWEDALAQAAPGDVIVFTYAGHGAAEPDLDGDEKTTTHPDDDLDEAFLLADFTDKSLTGYAERIVDDELARWFAAAEAKGVRVVFVADSCHSGTMTRQSASSRFAGAYAPPAGAPPVAAPTATPGDNITFIAAAAQEQATPEVNIGGRMRGAASYAFARALEGSADRDHDGVTTRDELAAYVTGVVRSLSDQTTPSVLPLGGGQVSVFGEGPPPAQTARPEPEITLAATGGPLLGSFGAATGPDFGAATLNWDRGEGIVLNAEGDTVAYNVKGKIQMRRVVDKYRLLEAVRAAAAADPVEVSLAGGAKIWAPGEVTELVVGPRAAPYLTIFTLSNTGEAALAFPYDAAEAGPLDPQAAIRIGFEVTPDGVGVEHVVAFASDFPPEGLRAALASGGPARRIIGPVSEFLSGRKAGAGVGRIVTRR